MGVGNRAGASARTTLGAELPHDRAEVLQQRMARQRNLRRRAGTVGLGVGLGVTQWIVAYRGASSMRELKQDQGDDQCGDGACPTWHQMQLCMAAAPVRAARPDPGAGRQLAREQGSGCAHRPQRLPSQRRRGCKSSASVLCLINYSARLLSRDDHSESSQAAQPGRGAARLAAGRHGAQLDALGVRVRGQLGVVLRAELDGRDAQVGQHLLRRSSAQPPQPCVSFSAMFGLFLVRPPSARGVQRTARTSERVQCGTGADGGGRRPGRPRGWTRASRRGRARGSGTWPWP